MKKANLFLVLIIMLFSESGCDNNDELANALLFGEESALLVTTEEVIDIFSTSATGGGNVTSDGGALVTARGIAYGPSLNPTTAGSTVSSGSGTGSFTANMTGLTPNTTYYVRAYATNSAAGTAYGNNVSFTTATDLPDFDCDIETTTTGTTYNITITPKDFFKQGEVIKVTMESSVYQFGQANNVSLYSNEVLVHNYGNWIVFDYGGTMANNAKEFILPTGIPVSNCYTIRVVKGSDIYVSESFIIIP